MKPSSHLSLLLFLHLTSAAPIPGLSSDCRRLRTCRDALSDDSKANNPAADQYLPPLHLPSAFDEATPPFKEPAQVSVITTEEDSSLESLGSSTSTSSESIVYGTAHYPVQVWRKGNQYDALNSPGNGNGRGFSWCERMRQITQIGSRQYSELLIVSIVVFFLVALMAWETVGRSDGLRLTFCDAGRRQGPICLPDEERGIILKRPAPLKRALSLEKTISWKESPDRWGRRESCCLEHAQPPTSCTCDEFSTSALISKCVRGVCE